jgi:transposase InsO family protein
VHADSRGTYGARRVHAELVLGRGVSVGHGVVEMLMRQAGISGITGRPKWRHAKPGNIARDLVGRCFTRASPDQLWVTDITEHPTYEGKGLLLRDARRLLPPGGRLVDRRLTDRGAGHQRPGHGPSTTVTPAPVR